MKRSNKIRTIILLSILVLTTLIVPSAAKKIKDEEIYNNKAYISSSLDISNYNIIIDVDKDNKYDITETITVNIPNNTFKGISRTIPKWQYYYNQQNINSIKGVITNLRVVGEQFQLDNHQDYQELKIGSKKINTSLGEHKYTIKYRYNAGRDLNTNYDLFVFNIFDNYDNTKINNLDITVNMPKPFADNIKFLDNANDITTKVYYEIENNTLKISLNNYELTNSLTMIMTLEDNYFIGGTYNYSFISLILIIVVIIICIISFINWLKYGKDIYKRASTVEFYAPDNLDAAEIGYIYGEENIKKLISALLIGLCSKKHINITKDNNNYVVSKQNSTKELTIIEEILYQELFKNNQVVYLNTFDFSLTSSKITSYLNVAVNRKVNDLQAKGKTKNTFILLFISIVLWLLSYLYFKDLNPKYNYLYLISFITIFITGLFTIIMERRTSYGEYIYARIKGFKDYLETTEKGVLEQEVHKNPNYFYDILPYTYVLGISNKWIDKFMKNNITNINVVDINIYTNEIFMII